MAKTVKGKATGPMMIRKTIRLPEAIERRTARYALETRRDFQDITAEALAEYLDRKGAKR